MGLYFSVLKILSAYALSLLTLGLEFEGVIPSLYSVSNIVAPFIGVPLSE